MPNRLYVRLADTGHVRVSNSTTTSGIRMSVSDLIKGMAQRGRP